MPILEKQVRRKMEEATLRSLRDGRIPSAAQIALEIASFVHRADGSPTMRPRYQDRKKVWDFRATNDVLKAIQFDLDVAYEEVVEQVAKLLRRMGLVELSYQSQKGQLDGLIALLRNLQLISKNTDDNFFGVFDSFTDLTKVDLANTTRDAVDLAEGVVYLPPVDVNVDRVEMSHLYNVQSWPIAASAPDDPWVPPPFGPSGNPGPPEGAAQKPSAPTAPLTASIVQNEPVTNAWFGFAFADMVNVWRQVVTTSNKKGVTIEFVVPMSSVNEKTERMTRISLGSGASQTMKVSVLHSMDAVNFSRLPAVGEDFDVPSGRTVAIDFEEIETRFVKFRVTMAEPTVALDPSFSYIFGFRHIAFYRMGRAQQAEFWSKAMTPPGMTKPIDKVSLLAVESIPPECDISWFVAAADGTGAPREGVWRPINPINRAPLDGVPSFVKFSESAVQARYLPSPSPALLWDTVREIGFYKLTLDPLPEEPLFQQAFLYRGENAWWRNTQREVTVREARDVFVDFNSGDVQNIYAVYTETPDVERRLRPGATAQTILEVSRRIDYDASTMSLIPPEDVDPVVDQRPRYAIYQVLRFRDQMRISDEAVNLYGTAWSSLANKGIRTTGTGRPSVVNTIESVVYTEGRDYELETDIMNRLTGRLRRTESSNIGSGDTVKVTYELEPDITHMVQAIDNGNFIVQLPDQGDRTDLRFQITYRFVPKAPENRVRKPTVRVTSQYGTSEGTVFEEGRDYLIDTEKGTITRMPGGNITGSLVVYMDFAYEQVPKDLDVFSGWFYVEKRDPIRVEYSPLNLDIDGGEQVLVDGVDISTKTEMPEMAFGWHQVTVRSRRPEAVLGAAIRKIAVLRDRMGEPIFIAGGNYFSRMTASRNPMLQKTVLQLTKGTPSENHDFFAITSDRHVIVNFEPGTTEQIYTYGLRRDEGVLVADEWAEAFRLEYTYRLETEDPVTQVLVRAIVTRGRKVGAGLTPKVMEYHLRVA